MIQKTPADATRASLERYTAYLEAQTDVRLSQLHQHLLTTDGPLAELDGAPESLIPLWAWVRREVRRGLPGAPADPAVSRFVFFGWPVDSNMSKLAWLAQIVSAYLLRVARSVDPSIRWGIPAADPDSLRWADDHEPGLSSSSAEFWPIESALINLAELAVDAPQATNDGQIHQQFVTHYGAGLGADHVPFAWPVALVPDNDPLPVADWDATSTDTKVAGRTGLGWRRGADTETALTLMSELGAVTITDRQPPGAELATAESGYLNYLLVDRQILIEVELRRRRVIEVRFISNGTSTSDWDALEALLPGLAKRYGARVLDIGT